MGDDKGPSAISLFETTIGVNFKRAGTKEITKSGEQGQQN